ncbi:hypothetical protein NDU88_006916 [Pleurodeles waltl]|uniref:Uncharacterized protein n=1 Tax=Pleurodeles waltl TaxID=8319 RepID=A0AAV7WDX4_PLEWA|nr:hypothetical protein NDU88_006916 [Pleurodeles waltl]
MKRGEHGGLRRSRSALGRFLFRSWGRGRSRWPSGRRAAAASTRMCALQSVRPEEVWRTAGAVWWHRAALELRRTCKSVARIPLRGNSSSGSCRTGEAATEKLRLGEQPKENPEKGARKKTVRQRGGGGRLPCPPLHLTRVEGTVLSPQDNLVVLTEEKGDKGGSAKKILRPKSGEGGRSAGRKVGESKLNGRDKLTPSLRSFFKVRPEVVTLIPGQVRAAMEVTTSRWKLVRVRTGRGRGPPRHGQEKNRRPQY